MLQISEGFTLKRIPESEECCPAGTKTNTLGLARSGFERVPAIMNLVFSELGARWLVMQKTHDLNNERNRGHDH